MADTSLGGDVVIRLALLASRLSVLASRFYLSLLGVGLTEARILAELANGVQSAAKMCESIGIDQAAISRSVKALSDLNYIALDTDGNDRRRKIISLTPAGKPIAEQVIEHAVRRSEILMQILTPGEQLLFAEIVKKLESGLPLLERDEEMIEKS